MSTPIEKSPPPQIAQCLLWFLIGCGVVLVLSLIAVKLPSDFKKLLLFYALFGLACGYLLGRIWRDLAGASSATVLGLGAILILLGSLNVGRLAYLDFSRHRQQLAARHPEQLAALNIVEQFPELNAEQREKYEVARREFEPRFSDYLAMRLTPLGENASQFGPLFWGIEIALATLLGTWMLSRAYVAQPAEA